MILTLDDENVDCKKVALESFEMADIHSKKEASGPLLELKERCKKQCAAGRFLPCFFACYKGTLFSDTLIKGIAKCKNCAENFVACGLPKCIACHAELKHFHPEACFTCMGKECIEDLKCGKHAFPMKLLA